MISKNTGKSILILMLIFLEKSKVFVARIVVTSCFESLLECGKIAKNTIDNGTFLNNRSTTPASSAQGGTIFVMGRMYLFLIPVKTPFIYFSGVSLYLLCAE